MRNKRHTTRAGFSLLELTMAVIIMSTLSGIAIPRFASSIANQRANATAQRILNDIARAQRAAKFTSAAKTLSFNPPQNRYQIDGMKDLDHPSQTYIIRLGESPYQATILSASFGGDTDLIFNGFGIPDSGGTVSIKVGPYTKTITVAANTGQITIQ
jgi:prepilin-type N-terminal cleavage/methylation domain-containing protein